MVLVENNERRDTYLEVPTRCEGCSFELGLIRERIIGSVR